MDISNITIRQIRIPLNFQFAQSNNSGSSKSNSTILQLDTKEGIRGFGEACPRTYVTGETFQTICHDLKKAKDIALHKSVTSFDELAELLENLKIGASTKCTLELAWLDAHSKSIKKSIPDLLRKKMKESIQYSIVLPLASSSSIEKLCARIKVFSPPNIKLKVNSNTQDQLEKIEIIRSFFGKDLPVRLDVNGGWTLDEATLAIPKFLKKNVHSFEQPLDPNDVVGSKKLTDAFGNDASIMADECLLSFQNAETILNEGIFNHLNLKISKLGGIGNTIKIKALADAHDIPCQLGAHFGETSLLTAAGLLVAGTCSEFSACEGALGTLLLKEDICSESIQQNLEGKVNSNNYFKRFGWLADMDESIIEKYTIDQYSWSSN